MKEIDTMSGEIYRYLNFNEIKSYVDQANDAEIPAINVVEAT